MVDNRLKHLELADPWASLGMRVRYLREWAGMTQKEFAEKLGTNQSSLGRKEAGKTRIHPSELKDIAAALGTTVEDLLSPKPVEELWPTDKPRLTKGEGNRIPVINYASAGEVVDYEEYGVD